MEKRLALSQYGSQLWTKDSARSIRARTLTILESLSVGDVLVIDTNRVTAFDLSFASELFGKTLLTFGVEFPGRFLIVESLNECTRENLDRALEGLSIMMIERSDGALDLIGKVHPADRQTFRAIIAAGNAVTAAALSKSLDVNLTAMNERLSKLTALTVLRREKASSASGREQYVYRVLA